MDVLFLKAASGLVTSPITVSDVGSNATGKSFAPPFKYPLRSLWPRGGATRLSAMATDDTFFMEEHVDQETRNWVFKILRFRNFRKDECKSWELEVDDKQNNDDDRIRSSWEEECNVCDQQDDGEKKIEMDKKSFLEMLRRVTLAQARLYAQMSYLGSLAYSIPQTSPFT